MPEEEKKTCYDLFKAKSNHQQRQFILDLMIASQSSTDNEKLKVRKLMYILTIMYASGMFVHTDVIKVLKNTVHTLRIL